MPVPEILQAMLTARYNGVTLTCILCSQTLFSTTFANTSINTSTDVITVNNTLVAGSRVQISTSGTLTADLTANEVLFVVNPTSTTLQVARSLGGTPINFTAQGTGTYTIAEVSILDPTVGGLEYGLRTVADAVRHEVASYQGQSTRPTVTGVSATLGLSPDNSQPFTPRVTITPTINNSGGGAGITFNFIAIISGGTTARGNTTGTLEDVITFASAQTVAAGVSVQPTLNFALRPAPGA